MKRMFDLVVSTVGLILVFPLLFIIAIFIKATMPGKVLFYQDRVGRYGKTFRMVKFRSMRQSHDKNTVTVIGDNRITPTGRFLRKYKLDELPELWNVIKGDMSLVGPRPDVPGFADKLEGEAAEILKLRPGITGPASLKYHNEEELLASCEDPATYNREVIFPDKVKINLAYVQKNSLLGDLVIIIKTIFAKKK